MPFETKAELLAAFKKAFPELVRAMKDTSHSAHGADSPWHLEDSVWTHTMMVLSHVDAGVEVAAAALLHDLGKVHTLEVSVKNGLLKNSFKNHEALSFYKARPILEKLGFDESQVRNILISIGAHGRFWGDDLKKMVTKLEGFDQVRSFSILELLNADAKGRISHKGDNTVLDLVKEAWPLYLVGESSLDNQPLITVLIGLPGSGKSSYVKRHVSECTVVVSRDALVEEFGIGQDYREKWLSVESTPEIKQKVGVTLERELQDALKSGNDIVIDMTNLTKRGRKRYSSFAKQHGYLVKHVVFAVDIDTCIARQDTRVDKTVSSEVIWDMAKNFTLPLYDEADIIELELS